MKNIITLIFCLTSQYLLAQNNVTDSTVTKTSADTLDIEYKKSIEIARDYFKNKNYRLALDAYEMIIKKWPNDSLATLELIETARNIYIEEGDKEYKNENYIDAQKMYERALKLKHDDAETLNKLEKTKCNIKPGYHQIQY